MVAGDMQSGVATYVRPRQRRTAAVVLTPKSTICPVCLTDTKLSECPANCLTREQEEKS